MRRSNRGMQSGAEAVTLAQVDRLIVRRPPRLSVSIAALPGKEREMLNIYSKVFRLRGYLLDQVDDDQAEGLVATFVRQTSVRGRWP